MSPLWRIMGFKPYGAYCHDNIECTTGLCRYVTAAIHLLLSSPKTALFENWLYFLPPGMVIVLLMSLFIHSGVEDWNIFIYESTQLIYTILCHSSVWRLCCKHFNFLTVCSAVLCSAYGEVSLEKLHWFHCRCFIFKTFNNTIYGHYHIGVCIWLAPNFNSTIQYCKCIVIKKLY